MALSERPLRIVTTNDFYGSYYPHPTSYGRLPGAGALRQTVDRLREGGETLWIDCGDFAQGGPLAPTSAGSLGFVAARELGIDVATIGNHEFDWGESHLRRWLAETRFPCVCANYDIGLPASTVLVAGPYSVGVIALTHPALDSFHAGLSLPLSDAAAAVRREAATLRRQGAGRVIVAMHDGVDWAWTADGCLRPEPARLEEVVAAFASEVDAVLGGHTLARWVGELAGVPFVQPWAFGAEVGIVDIFPDGRVAVSAEAVTGEQEWDGVGAGLHAALKREIVGELARPLVAAPMKERSLPAAIARGMLATTGADVAIVSPAEIQTMQPPLDGAFAYLPAGPISEADVLRVIPWLDDTVCVAEVTAGEVEQIVAFIAEPASWADYGAPEVAGQLVGNSGTVVLNQWYARRVEGRLARDLAWRPVGGQRAALRHTIAS